MSSNNSSATTARRTSPRRAASAASLASSSAVVRVLQSDLVGEEIDEEPNERVQASEHLADAEQRASLTDSAVTFWPIKIFCDMDNCVGRAFQPSQKCSLCEADLHMECFLGVVRKLKEYPEGCHDEVFCSDVCCLWHGNPRINVDSVRKERSEMSKLLKKQLVELARSAKVRVTQRVNKKSLQMSKAMMIRCLMVKKFDADVAGPAAAPPRPEKTVHARFRLVNCIFSDDLSQFAQEADNVDRAALDSGAVGDNSTYWKLCEERFNNGFAVNSVDGPTFADKVHFNHPIIDGHHDRVQPNQHGTFTSYELRSLWKEMQKEYDKVFTNFKKSGNHHSSFTKSAMDVCRREALGDADSVESSMNSADIDDVFGQEQGGFCCFTNSVVMIYLRLWLNERPGLTGFVSRHIPDEFQVDTLTAPACTATAVQSTIATKRTMNRSPPDVLAESINNLAKARKVEDGKKAMHDSIAQFHIIEAKKTSISAKMEEITLVQMQIGVLKERLEQCVDETKKGKYQKGLDDLEEKLDGLLML